jgi:hypothetical protein
MRPVRFEGQPEVQIKIDVSEDYKAYNSFNCDCNAIRYTIYRG